MEDKLLPSSEEAESGILSCLLQAADLIDDAQIEIAKEHFYNPANRILFETIQAMHSASMPVDMITLTNQLSVLSQLENVGGPGRIAEIYAFIPTPAHYPHYKLIIKDKFTIRSLAVACEEELEKALSYTEKNIAQLVTSVAERFNDIASPVTSLIKKKSFKEATIDFIDDFQGRMTGEIEIGIKTRWPCFNKVFGGIIPQYWLVAAYPSVGKTTFAQNMAEDALECGHGVAIFSLEMSQSRLLNRLVSARAKVSSKKIFNPKDYHPDRGDFQRISKAILELKDMPLFIEDDPYFTIEQIQARVRALVLKHGIKMVIIDYLQLVKTTANFENGNTASRLEYISRTCQAMSAKHGIAVVVLSQLSDEGKTKGSRAPGEDASCAIQLVPATSEIVRGKVASTPAGVSVVKNRDMERGAFLPLILNGEYFTFEERANHGDKQVSKPRYGDE